MVQVANPIYDTVFKYLMDDNESAKLLISGIIGEDVEEVMILPQENTVEMEHQTLTVYRLDFSAKIRVGDGEVKQVLIEIQKAKFSTDIMRFRKYLGEQYSKRDNFYLKTVNGREERCAVPIISIYFLGYGLDKVTAPIIKVNRQYLDVTTGREIPERETFIESLTHDSYVIQIPYLREKHQTDIELLLSIFDQKHTSADHHVLDVNESDYPEKYQPVIRRLLRAVAEPELRKKMDIEDELVEYLQEKERETAESKKVIEEQRKALDEKDKALDEKDKALDEKDKALDEKDKALIESQKLIEELRKKLENHS